jgi:hypothetical protein
MLHQFLLRLQARAIFYPDFCQKKLRNGVGMFYLHVQAQGLKSQPGRASSPPSWLCGSIPVARSHRESADVFACVVNSVIAVGSF